MEPAAPEGSMPATATPLLRWAGASLGYAGAPVLRDIELALHPGEALALLGRNGAGKTTLLHGMLGLGPRLLAGHLHVAGQVVDGWPTHRIARLGLGLVPQGRGVFADLRVEDNLKLALLRRADAHAGTHTAGVAPAWTLARVYELFPRLAERRRAASGSLSGGERQMLALARALLTQPRVLILDEPSEGLAPMAAQELIAGHVGALARQGLTVLLAEQNLPLALRLATRVVILADGGIAYDGSPAELACRPELQREYLGV